MWGGIISYLYRQNKGRGSTNFVTGLEPTRFSQSGEKKTTQTTQPQILMFCRDLNLQPSHLQSDVLSTELLRPIVTQILKQSKNKFRIKPKILQVQFLGWIYIAVNILISTVTHSSMVVVCSADQMDAGSTLFSILHFSFLFQI